MKGAPGLIVAVFLGLLGVVLNWVYLDNKTRDVDIIRFIGIRDGVTIQPGQQILSRHLEPVPIPARYAENLKDYVYLYEDLDTVTGVPAARAFRGGELFYRDDYVTPPTELDLEANEFAFWITIDSRAIVPELIVPDDLISFHFPMRSSRAMPTTNEDPRESAVSSSQIEELGPFRVASLGNRLGSPQVMRAGRRSPTQEQKIGLVVDKTDAEEMAQFRKIQARILSGDYQQMSVTLHSRQR